MTYSFEDFARDSNVSRETLFDYQTWHALLLKSRQRLWVIFGDAMRLIVGRYGRMCRKQLQNS